MALLEKGLGNFMGGKSVTIVKITDCQELELDEHALAGILKNEKLRNTPIMVVSVSGAFRRGKSFLLTILLRYLRKNGVKNNDWLGLRSLCDGFRWQGGIAPVTMGIVMWNEPFFVWDKSDKKVAVLLMDTQGLFDNQTSKTLCTAIFAFSTLLSSVQVYNVSSQIQGDNLEYLDFFVSYAQSVRNATEKPKDSAPFQKLVFLVRDWSSPRSHSYGEDSEEEGKSYLSEILGKREESAGIDVSRNLRTSFETLKCFFLPYPGEKVAVEDEEERFEGAPIDISKKFKQHVNEFAGFLFRPENVVPKKFGDRNVYASDLLNYAICCGREFKRGKLPDISSMKEATAVTLCIRISEIILQEYDNAMEVKGTEDYVPDEELANKHSATVANLLVEFKSRICVGEEQLISKYIQELEKTLHDRFNIVRGLNEVKKGKKEAEMACQVVQYLEEHDFGIPESCSVSSFRAYHEEFAKERKKRFMQKFGRYPESQRYLQQLDDKLRNALERQLEMKEQTVRNSRQEDCIRKYRLLLEKVQSKYVDEKILDKECEQAKTNIQDTYCLVEPIEKIPKLRKDIGYILEREKRRIQKSNAEKEDSVRLLFKIVIDELQTTYTRVMLEGMRSVHVETSVLVTVHGKMKEMLKQKLKSNDQIKKKYNGSILWEEFSEAMDKNLDEEFKRHASRNEGNEDLYPRTVTKVADFFVNALVVVLAIIGAPIAIAVGIPALIGYGLVKGASAIFGKLKIALQKKTED